MLPEPVRCGAVISAAEMESCFLKHFTLQYPFAAPTFLTESRLDEKHATRRHLDGAERGVVETQGASS